MLTTKLEAFHFIVYLVVYQLFKGDKSTVLKQIEYIYLADDDSDDCYLFQEALNEVNDYIRLNTAEDGLVLMDTLHKDTRRPDIIFLDINMPGKNGFECLEEIRSAKELRKIPVVVLSTSDAQESIDKAYENGANWYVQKPTSFKGLKKLISHCLERDWERI